MAATVIDGKAFAAQVRGKVAEGVARVRREAGVTPGLAVVLVGEDPASQVYVRAKGKQTLEAGMESFEHRLDAGTAEGDLLALVERLNADAAVHGILVQLPLPGHIDEAKVLAAIDPAKDVDGFHISNVGLLATGQKAMVPCTPLGCLMLLRAHLGEPVGHARRSSIGRSNIVGKPMTAAAAGRVSCTVTVAPSSRTKRPARAWCDAPRSWSRPWGRPNMVPGRLDRAGRHGDRRGHQPRSTRPSGGRARPASWATWTTTVARPRSRAP